MLNLTVPAASLAEKVRSCGCGFDASKVAGCEVKLPEAMFEFSLIELAST